MVYLKNRQYIEPGESISASFAGLVGFLLIGYINYDINQHRYQIYSISGTNEYDTQCILLSDNDYIEAGDSRLVNIYTNDTSMDCCIQNLSDKETIGYIAYIGLP